VSDSIEIIGGGLAGCEAALSLAGRGHSVRLVEMRPVLSTPAHQTDRLGELVCTNSFKSEDPANAHGQLKREMEALGSLLLRVAGETRVPAGSALAVDRDLFSRGMTGAAANHPNIVLVREERTDAIAPIVHRESVNEEIVFEAGRFGEDADYLNCPMDLASYCSFLEALKSADIHSSHEFDSVPYFEGCLPIEVMASRGDDTLRFGPMKPIGLEDPRTGQRPHAVVQLRREDLSGQMWNLVGFQTRLKVGEQGRVFRMIPGLEEAEFLRWGSIHRNSYLNFPGRLTDWGALKARPDLIFAGQITGVEGYTESAASGLLAAANLHRVLEGKTPVVPPRTSILGGLLGYLRDADPNHFQPMNSNWGLVEPLPKRIRDKRKKRVALAARAQADFLAWVEEEGVGL